MTPQIKYIIDYFCNAIMSVHSFLCKDLGAALKQEGNDDFYIRILFVAELISFGSLFISEGSTSHLILIYLLIPIVFLPFKFTPYDSNRFPIVICFSFYNIFRNIIICRTPLFLSVIIYGSNKAYLSYLYPEPSLGYLHIFFYYLLAPLLVFIIATTRLSVDMKGFYFLFFKFVSPLVALNIIINLYFFVKNIGDIKLLPSYRLASTFSNAMGYNPNLDALIHAIFFAGLVITLTNQKIIKYRIILFSSLLTIFVALLWEQSRASSLAMIFSLLIFALIVRPKINVKLLFFTFFLILISGIYLFWILPHGFSSYYLRADYYRPELWIKFFNLSRDNSFYGFGDRLELNITLSNGTIITHAHSILLTALVRGGLIGFFSMLFITVMGTISSYKYYKYSKNILPFCLFLIVMIAGLVDFELKIWQAGWYLAGYWLVIAIVVGSDATLKNRDRLLKK